MFDRIAARYDLLNRVISFGLDAWWRKKVIQQLPLHKNRLILDLGTGTGDLAFAGTKGAHGNERIVGLDASLQMLRLARAKQRFAPGGHKTDFVQGTALLAPFRESVFDAAMTAFVLRNVSDLPEFFANGFRLLKPGGRMVSLDIFPPSKSWFSVVYGIYFYRIVPSIGALLACNRGAYGYLAESVRQFSSPETISALIEQAGFRRIIIHKFLNGVVCMHVAEKPAVSTASS